MVKIVAEIGINHNGDIGIAKKLIDLAVNAGCDYVKFQKRTVDVVYTKEELEKPRESPFGTTNGELKRGLEFGKEEYDEIDRYCREKGIGWFASCWDKGSVDFIAQYNPPYFKIASACLTDDELLRHHLRYDTPIILSTGMSTMEQIRHAVSILKHNLAYILHCTSTYPSKPEELNLRCIKTLQNEFPDVSIGYSGHESIFPPSYVAAVMGAEMIEKHITLDRAMWGSDQAASIEPVGLEKLVRYIKTLDRMMGDGIKVVYDSELPLIQKLRRVG